MLWLSCLYTYNWRCSVLRLLTHPLSSPPNWSPAAVLRHSQALDQVYPATNPQSTVPYTVLCNGGGTRAQKGGRGARLRMVSPGMLRQPLYSNYMYCTLDLKLDDRGIALHGCFSSVSAVEGKQQTYTTASDRWADNCGQDP